MSVCVRACQHGGMARIVMQEEKVRQCKVFVVLMQGEDSCSDRSDAAAAPACMCVCGAEMGSTFYSPLPLCFFQNGEKEVENAADLQHSYVHKPIAWPPTRKQLIQNQEINQLTVFTSIRHWIKRHNVSL